MLKKGKVERAELYKDRNTQIFLSRFLSGEFKELEPVYDPKTGYSYPLVEAVLGDVSRAEAFLNQLSEAGVLEKKLYDKVIFCPKCVSTNISVRYCCPYCRSFDVQKSSLIEHVKCGYMDVEENFRRNNKLFCPKCNDELKKLDVDHRKAGIWCTCKDCGKSFDIPIASHFCRECHGSFSFEEISIRNAYSYSLRAEAREEAALGWVLVAPIREFLVQQGFEAQSPAFLKGKSGANHSFDIVASKKLGKGRLTVIDIATSPDSVVSEQPVIALFAKIFDVSPDVAFLIAIPKIGENGKKMAELYHIQIIEAANQKEATEALAQKLRK